MSESIGLDKDRAIKVTAITVEGESFTFEEPQSRDEARVLAQAILKDGFSINGGKQKEVLRPGEEQYFPPASVYKVAIHYSTHVKGGQEL